MLPCYGTEWLDGSAWGPLFARKEFESVPAGHCANGRVFMKLRGGQCCVRGQGSGSPPHQQEARTICKGSVSTCVPFRQTKQALPRDCASWLMSLVSSVDSNCSIREVLNGPTTTHNGLCWSTTAVANVITFTVSFWALTSCCSAPGIQSYWSCNVLLYSLYRWTVENFGW